MNRLTAWADAHLIDNWRTEWKRLWSVRIFALGLIISVLEMAVTLWPSMQDHIPFDVFWKLGITLSVVGFLARYVKQKETKKDDDDGDDN